MTAITTVLAGWFSRMKERLCLSSLSRLLLEKRVHQAAGDTKVLLSLADDEVLRLHLEDAGPVDGLAEGGAVVVDSGLPVVGPGHHEPEHFTTFSII